MIHVRINLYAWRWESHIVMVSCLSSVSIFLLAMAQVQNCNCPHVLKTEFLITKNMTFYVVLKSVLHYTTKRLTVCGFLYIQDFLYIYVAFDPLEFTSNSIFFRFFQAKLLVSNFWSFLLLSNGKISSQFVPRRHFLSSLWTRCIGFTFSRRVSSKSDDSVTSHGLRSLDK